MAIESWAEKTVDGTKSDSLLLYRPRPWDKVRAESYSCNGQKCPHYKRCFFFKARRKVEEAQILVVNHHLLFSDLAAKAKGKAILPSYARLVIDEAHHLEDVARECLSRKCDRLGLIRQLGKLHSDINPERSRFFQLRQKSMTPPSALDLKPSCLRKKMQ